MIENLQTDICDLKTSLELAEKRNVELEEKYKVDREEMKLKMPVPVSVISSYF